MTSYSKMPCAFCFIKVLPSGHFRARCELRLGLISESLGHWRSRALLNHLSNQHPLARWGYMDFAAPPSARLCIYTHSGRHTHRAFSCHGGLRTIQRLAIKIGLYQTEQCFARLCLKLYLLRFYRLYKAEPGVAPRGGHFAALLYPLSVRILGCVLDPCKFEGLEPKSQFSQPLSTMYLTRLVSFADSFPALW